MRSLDLSKIHLEIISCCPEDRLTAAAEMAAYLESEGYQVTKIVENKNNIGESVNNEYQVTAKDLSVCWIMIKIIWINGKRKEERLKEKKPL